MMSFIEHLRNRGTYPGYPSVEDRRVVDNTEYRAWEKKGYEGKIVDDLNDHPSYLEGLRRGDALGDDGERRFWGMRFAPSFTGRYSRDGRGRPLHPYMRVILAAGLGVGGMGAYWTYGPNLCADPIVLGVSKSGELQAIAIRRHDTGEIALPGGYCDDGEDPTVTAARELAEETGVELVPEDVWWRIDSVFQGIVPGSRTTIHAWHETTAVAFILCDGVIDSCNPVGADDAAEAFRLVVNDEFYRRIIGPHADYVRLAVERFEEERGVTVRPDGQVVKR